MCGTPTPWPWSFALHLCESILIGVNSAPYKSNQTIFYAYIWRDSFTRCCGAIFYILYRPIRVNSSKRPFVLCVYVGWLGTWQRRLLKENVRVCTLCVKFIAVSWTHNTESLSVWVMSLPRVSWAIESEHVFGWHLHDTISVFVWLNVVCDYILCVCFFLC